MASPDATAAAPRPRLVVAVGALERVAWLSVLRVMLGAVFVSTFFENLNKHLYEAKGYTALILRYRAEGTAPGAWKDVEKFVADHASFFAPVQAVFELSLGVLLVLGIGTGLLGSFAAARAISRFLFATSPNDPLTLTAGCALLSAVALAATLIPAVRATRIDPQVALRHE